LTASVSLIQRSAQILKGGYLLVPSLDSSKWVRRFVELRRPYLHIHSIPEGEEIGIVNLRNSRVDHQPQIAKLLRQDGKGRDRKETVFAIYGTDNTWLFAARSEREKVDWIFKIDQAYFGNGNGSADDDAEAES
jgi:kinesin family protein 1